MIITATNATEARNSREWLKAMGFTYKCSIYWSEEWRKDDQVIFLHKGYDNNGRLNSEWRQYVA